ncbi:MAG: alpha/beta hydrolase [Burkholderiaceae bacterium]|jgi:pimeloyl-ACP methyl ester carboxylesterase
MALVQFSHANGFPAGSYQTFLGYWPPSLKVRAVERIGVDPTYPITDGWPHLVRQLVEQIEDASEAPILVGHSLGGLLSLQAAYRVPKRVRAVILLEAPILNSRRAAIFALAKLVGIETRVTPAGLTQRRRERWPTRADARRHFLDRGVFSQFDPRALDDYIRAGLVDDSQGVSLAIDRTIESNIYRTIPHTLHRLAKRPSIVPFGFIGGRRSREIALAGAALSEQFCEPHFRWIDGTHLFPMEHPEQAAQVIVDLMVEMKLL